MHVVLFKRSKVVISCPSHPGRDHLCVVDSEETSPHMMDCLCNQKNPQPASGLGRYVKNTHARNKNSIMYMMLVIFFFRSGDDISEMS